uniref:Uncharacterized protein n=1 Tax=Tetranychus urticae TaxID=32264 RepID=T1K275_TETUR
MSSLSLGKSNLDQIWFPYLAIKSYQTLQQNLIY